MALVDRDEVERDGAGRTSAPEERGSVGWVPWVGTVARLLLGGTLVVAGALKAVAVTGAVASVRAYDLLPGGLATAMGYTLPFLEIAVGVLLVVGLFTRVAAAVGGLLMVMFVIGIASAWARGLNIDCGCFGTGGSVAAGQTKYLQDILRDGGLFLAGLFLVWRPRTRLSLDGILGGAHHDADHDDHDDYDDHDADYDDLDGEQGSAARAHLTEGQA
ncbi:MAG: DoxX family protein [Motilibacteraceae bacterium]